MSEPTDPLAELRDTMFAADRIGAWVIDQVAAEHAGVKAIRYLTSPEAEVEIARVIDDHGRESSSRELVIDDPDALALAILRFIAEKAVQR